MNRVIRHVFLALLFSLVHLTPVQAPAQHKAPTPPLRSTYWIQDGGQRKLFELAMDEISIIDPNGKRTALKTIRCTTPRALLARAQTEENQSGRQTDLVLYQRGADKNAISRRHVTRKVLIKIKDGADAAHIAGLAKAQKTETRPYAPGYIILHVPGSGDALIAAEMLRSRSDVVSAEPLLARVRQKKALPNDTLFNNQWHLRNIGQTNGAIWMDVNVTSVWDKYRGAGVTIGIVDDGVQHTHPDLQPNYNTDIDYDFNDRDDDASPVVMTDDTHGTQVAGLAGARGSNSLGVAGVAYESTITGLRLIAGPSTDVDDADAMAHSNGTISVKNNSWGAPDARLVEGPGPLTQAALADGAANGRGGRGTVYVFSGGNGNDLGENANCDGYANSVYTIAVGAIDDAGFQCYYSEPGANLIVCAPSGDGLAQANVTTTDLVGNDGDNTNGAPDDLDDRDYTQKFSGTSGSAPIVSGVVALMLNANPDLGWRDIQEILLCSARRNHAADRDWSTNSAGFRFNHKYGAGMIDAQAAVGLALHWTNLPPQTSVESGQTGLGLAIPDNDSNGVTTQFSFADSTTRVEHVTVHVEISHTFCGDLEITLTSPGGMASTLVHPLPYSQDPLYQFTTWTFTSVRHWGENAAGNWNVRIADHVFEETGTVHSITVTLFGSTINGAQPIPAGYSLIAENNVPPNADVDPGETVTISFGLRNAGDSSTANLTATLLAVGGIRNPSAAQQYGVLTPAGPIVPRQFSFTAAGACGSSVTALFALEDGGNNLGIVGFPIALGSVTSQVFNSTGGITIPNSGNGNPYPSTIDITGLDGHVHDVTVDLNGLSHTWFDDISTLLVCPTDLQVILEDSGSPGPVGSIDLSFDGHADLYIPPAVGASGTYKPYDYYGAFPPSTPDGETAFVLEEFNGVPANGAWRLYIHDWATGDSGSLAGWNLNVTTVDCTDNVFFQQPIASVDEAPGTLTILVTRTAGKGGAASVNYSTSNGSASAGTDYVATSGTLTFEPAQLSRSFEVAILDDAAVEGPETFNVILSGASGNTILGTVSNAQITINDSDDVPPECTITRTGSSPTNVDTVGFAIDFSEPVTGFEIGDVVLALSGTAGTTANFAGAGAGYVVDVTGVTGNGTVGISVPADCCQDTDGTNANGNVAGAQVSYQIDNTSPVAGTVTNVAGAGPFDVSYSGASDGGSGLKDVTLWYKKDAGGWTSSWLTRGTGAGVFTFTPGAGNGTYYFGLVAADHAGNSSPVPTGAGDASAAYYESLNLVLPANGGVREEPPTLSELNASYGAERLTDGAFGTQLSCWVTALNPPMPQEVVYSFSSGSVARISYVVMHNYRTDYSCRDVTILTSMDAAGGSFTVVSNLTLAAGTGAQQFNLASVFARRILVRITSGFDASYLEMAEFEAHGYLVDATTDSDSDNLPDLWEIDCFSNITAYAGVDDPDGDGADNANEHGADTGPMDSNSVLRILGIAAEPGGMRLDWQGGTSVWQFLECCPDLLSTSDVWMAIFSNQPPTTVFTNRMDPGGTNRVMFYRIRVERP